MRVHRLMKRPEGLGALEYVARIALGPLVLVLPLVGWLHGWDEVWGPAAIVLVDLALAIRWQDFRLVKKVGTDPGGSLGPLTKVVMVGAALLAPLMLAEGLVIRGLAVAVLGVASAGLWLNWRWSGWAWIAYAVIAMADWLGDLLGLTYEAIRSPGRLPMARYEPLLERLPTVLFAAAVLTWVLEWRHRQVEPKQPKT